MSCCSCFPFLSKNKDDDGDGSHNEQNTRTVKEIGAGNEDGNNGEHRTIAAQTFTFRELASATKNFRPECLLGEGGFGRVYKGTLEKSGQVVAVKQLDRNGMHGNKDFLSEVLTLNLLHHQNLVNLVGYCADGDQRLLVYEFMSGGSLEEHLLDFKPEMKPLDWFTRMKIASGITTGLEYLHQKANPPVIYRDLKSSNILLDEESNPKLSDIGLAKLGNNGDKKSVLPSRVMGTYGYSAPEYTRSGELTLKSDVYSFGVVLLELITGRRALDTTRPNTEQNLVTWAQPLFRDPKRFPEMADPLLRGQFPERGLNQAVAIAAMCLQEESSVRPLISDISSALGFLAIPSADDLPPPLPAPDENCSKEEVVEDQEIQGSDNSGDEYSVFDEDEDENKEDNSGQKDGLSISTLKGQRDSQRESDSGKSDGSYASASSSRNVSRKTTYKSSSESQLGSAASKQIRGSSNEREMNGNASIAPKRSNTAENASAYSSPRNSINGESLNGNDSFRHRSTSKKDGTDNYFAHSFSIASTGSHTNDELGNTGHRSNKNSLKSSKSLSKILRNRLSLTSSNKKKAVQELEPGSEASS